MSIENHLGHSFGNVHFMIIFEPQIHAEIDRFLSRLNTNVAPNISGQNLV